MSHHLAGDLVTGGAARALDGDLVGIVEKFVEAVFPAAEDGEDAFEVAPAVETKPAGFQERGFLGGRNRGDGGFVERFEPGQVAVGLGGEQGEILIVKPEAAARALFGAVVELGDPRDRVVANHFEGGKAGFGVLGGGGLGIEVIMG